jgi:trk system potassium uptake protein TrkH
MTFFVFITYLLGMKMSMQASIVAKQSLATDSLSMLGNFFKKVLLYTVTFEAAGAFVLAIFWMNKFSTQRAIYLGVFHSISAFCTAGFSVLSSNLMDYKNSLTVNLTISVISIIGGIGFFVLMDLYSFFYKKCKGIMPRRLTCHSRLALLVTLAVMLSGAIIIFMSEKWPKDAGIYDKIMTSSFQAISASTTDGFNTLDIGAMSLTSLTVLMVLMFIGASPGSTGGGMKTTTFGVLISSVKSYLHGKTRVNIFKRELPDKNILEAFTLFGLFLAIVIVDIIILANIERGSYVQTLFEIISALGNTGLSTGITSSLTFTGKLVLIITMFIGRVGPLTIVAAFIARGKPADFKYAQEEVFIG